jgi:hypothetical protein
MRRAIPPLPQYALISWCLVKHRDNFTFTFYDIDMTGHVACMREMLNAYKVLVGISQRDRLIG